VSGYAVTITAPTRASAERLAALMTNTSCRISGRATQWQVSIEYERVEDATVQEVLDCIRTWLVDMNVSSTTIDLVGNRHVMMREDHTPSDAMHG